MPVKFRSEACGQERFRRFGPKKLRDALLCVLFLSVPSPMRAAEARADTALDAWIQKYNQEGATKATRVTRIDSLKEEIAKVEKARGLTGNIVFDFSGDEAGKLNFFDLLTSVEVAREAYPTEIRFRVSSDVRYRNSENEATVSDALVNYDYHPSRRLELFAFAQRFSDSFMSIKERYEVGVGFKLSLIRHSRPSLLEQRSTEEFISWSKPLVEDEVVRKEAFGDKPPDAAPIRGLDDIRDGAYLRGMTFALELAVSVLKELEQAELDTLSAAGSAASGAPKALLPVEDRYRAAVRPTLRWKPTQKLSIETIVYFKFPISEPFEFSDAFDWRIDGWGKVELAFDEREKVSVVARVDEHFDNVPPSITTGSGNIAAEHHHRVVHLGIKFKWK